jgi:hypothetical protein
VTAGQQTRAMVGVEALLTNLGHEPQMAGDELVRRVAVAVLAPALGQHIFFLALQHREPPDLIKIMSGMSRRMGSNSCWMPASVFSKMVRNVMPSDVAYRTRPKRQ